MSKTRKLTGLMMLAVCAVILAAPARGEPDTRSPQVKLLRVPNGGIQPQVAVDRMGTIHLIYFHGDPANGDVFYARVSKTEKKFSDPIGVNSIPGSAIAIGNIRGPQLAIGKNGRIHVVWNGSDKAVPKGPHN